MLSALVMTPRAAGPRLDEAQDRLDLRPHAARAEMPFRRVALGLGHGERVEPQLVGLAEADRDPLDAGRDHQQVGLHLDREQRRGAVLVDHRLDAAQLAVRASPRRRCRRRRSAMIITPSRARRSMIGASITRTGCGDAITRRQPRLPSCITVQPSSAASSPRDLLGHERADRLVRVRERRIVHGRRRVCVTSVTTGLSMPRRLQRVDHRVLEHEADRALRVGDRVADRHRRAPGRSAISERRRMKPTCGPLPCVSTTFQPAAIMSTTCAAVAHTASYWSCERRVLRVADQRVAADGDDGDGLASCRLRLADAVAPAPSPRR